jgi:hypothetical protein
MFLRLSTPAGVGRGCTQQTRHVYIACITNYEFLFVVYITDHCCIDMCTLFPTVLTSGRGLVANTSVKG